MINGIQVFGFLRWFAEAGRRGKIGIDHTGAAALVAIKTDPPVVINLFGEDAQAGGNRSDTQLFIAFLDQQFV
jgi:hypothetical protein